MLTLELLSIADRIDYSPSDVDSRLVSLLGFVSLESGAGSLVKRVIRSDSDDDYSYH